jgi:hypothetical protein
MIVRGVGCNRLFGGMSHRWLGATTCVPEGEHLKCIVGHPVVDVVSNPREGDPTNTGQCRATRHGSDNRLYSEEFENPIEIVADGVGSCWAILGPPRRGG